MPRKKATFNVSIVKCAGCGTLRGKLYPDTTGNLLCVYCFLRRAKKLHPDGYLPKISRN